MTLKFVIDAINKLVSFYDVDLLQHLLFHTDFKPGRSTAVSPPALPLIFVVVFLLFCCVGKIR
jgi:hypothetical protein